MAIEMSSMLMSNLENLVQLLKKDPDPLMANYFVNLIDKDFQDNSCNLRNLFKDRVGQLFSLKEDQFPLIYLDRLMEILKTKYNLQNGSFVESSIESSDLDRVKLAVEKGCDINHDNGYALFKVINKPIVNPADREIIEYLLKNGADPNLRGFGRVDLLEILAFKGDDQLFEILIQYGAKWKSNWIRILEGAVHSNNLEITEYIIKNVERIYLDSVSAPTILKILAADNKEINNIILSKGNFKHLPLSYIAPLLHDPKLAALVVYRMSQASRETEIFVRELDRLRNENQIFSTEKIGGFRGILRKKNG